MLLPYGAYKLFKQIRKVDKTLALQEAVGDKENFLSSKSSKDKLDSKLGQYCVISGQAKNMMFEDEQHQNSKKSPKCFGYKK